MTARVIGKSGAAGAGLRRRGWLIAVGTIGVVIGSLGVGYGVVALGLMPAALSGGRAGVMPAASTGSTAAAPGAGSVAPSPSGSRVPPPPPIAGFEAQMRAKAASGLDALDASFPSLIAGYTPDWFRLTEDDRPPALAGGLEGLRSRRELWALFFAGAFDYTLVKPAEEGGARVVFWNPLVDAALVAEILPDARIWAWSVLPGTTIRAGETPGAAPLWLATADGGTLAALIREHADTVSRLVDRPLPIGPAPGQRPRSVEAAQDAVLVRVQTLATGAAVARSGAMEAALRPLIDSVREGEPRELGRRI